MEKIKIIDELITLFNENISKLEELKANVKQSEEFNTELLNKVDKIGEDTREIRKGVIG